MALPAKTQKLLPHLLVLCFALKVGPSGDYAVEASMHSTQSTTARVVEVLSPVSAQEQKVTADVDARDNLREPTLVRLYALLDDGDYLDARAIAEACVFAEPTDAECMHGLIWSFTRAGDYGAELDVYLDDCSAVFPDDNVCQSAAILSAIQKADIRHARDLWERQYRGDGAPADDMEAKLLNAIILQAEGDTSSACVLYGDVCSNGQPFACAEMQTCDHG